MLINRMEEIYLALYDHMRRDIRMRLESRANTYARSLRDIRSIKRTQHGLEKLNAMAKDAALKDPYKAMNTAWLDKFWGSMKRKWQASGIRGMFVAQRNMQGVVLSGKRHMKPVLLRITFGVGVAHVWGYPSAIEWAKNEHSFYWLYENGKWRASL